MSEFLLSLLRFYKKHISPHLPPMCRYEPSCSVYAMQAIEIHGPLKGCLLAAGRLLRCNILFPGGYDPVPPKNDRHDLNRRRK